MTDQSSLLKIKIDSVAFEGKGIARLDGKVVFIPDTIEGDEVLAQITEDNGRYAEGRMVELISPSPHRGPSPCRYSDSCGGCQWQGVDYDQQLKWKKNFVISAISRIGKMPVTGDIKIIPSPTTLHYRNRVLLRCHIDADGTIQVGYFKRASRELVPIDACKIAVPAINLFISSLMSLKFKEHAGQKVRFEIQELPLLKTPNGDTQVVVTIFPTEGEKQNLNDLLSGIRSIPTVAWADLIFAQKTAPFLPFEEHLGVTFHTSPGQFQQVNLVPNRILRELIKTKVDSLSPDRILDVFCGSGNLSLPLANGTRYIEGVEYAKRAIDCANYNVKQNRIENTLYLAGDAEKHLWKVSRKGEPFDLVIVDPPRQGMYKAIIPLKNIAAKNIIYVSCDPATLARDLGSLCKKDYSVEEILTFDFFPNTYHVETVVFLKKN